MGLVEAVARALGIRAGRMAAALVDMVARSAEADTGAMDGVGPVRRRADRRTTIITRPRFGFIAGTSTCNPVIMTDIRRDIADGS